MGNNSEPSIIKVCKSIEGRDMDEIFYKKFVKRGVAFYE